MKAQRCPVCDGTGKYKKKKCHGCNGRGWVEVRDYIPYWPNPYPNPYVPYPKDYDYWRWYHPHTYSDSNTGVLIKEQPLFIS